MDCSSIYITQKKKKRKEERDPLKAALLVCTFPFIVIVRAGLHGRHRRTGGGIRVPSFGTAIRLPPSLSYSFSFFTLGVIIVKKSYSDRPKASHIPLFFSGKKGRPTRVSLCVHMQFAVFSRVEKRIDNLQGKKTAQTLFYVFFYYIKLPMLTRSSVFFLYISKPIKMKYSSYGNLNLKKEEEIFSKPTL